MSEWRPPTTVSLHEWQYEQPPALTFRVRSRYVERVWLPQLGPTPMLLLRLLTELIEHGDRDSVDVSFLASAVGIGSAHGTKSTLARALRRLERFSLVTLTDTSIAVRTELPPLNNQDAARLPPELRAIHERLARASATCEPGGASA